MKKIPIIIMLCIAMLSAAFAGCTKPSNLSDEAVPTVINTAEYTLYQNIFYNDMGADYESKEVTKAGTFTTLQDSFSDVTRYYVWGYNDQTKCCDWQWEIKFDDTSSLPSNGSLVEVKGVFEKSENALDGYWITSPELTVQTEYKGEECDIDMLTMSGTLERVEIQNIQINPESFEGKTVSVYGRVNSIQSIQHPYYDGAWEEKIVSDSELPAIGTMVVAAGVITDGDITECTVAKTSNY